MQAIQRSFGVIHAQSHGAAGAPAVIFANSLGTDLRLWSKVLPLLPQELRYICYDKRGHGLSGLDGDVSSIEDHAEDAIAVIEALAGSMPVIFVGLSIGGLIAQKVAEMRPDLIRALVLSNTAAKLGTKDTWGERIAAIRADGLASISAGVMQRWFGAGFRAKSELALWQAMFERCAPAGYIAACHALAGGDQRAATALLTCPTLLVGGSEDGSTPPDVVRGLADLIKGAQYHEIAGAGHLPCVEAPAVWAAIVAPFLQEHAHG